MRRDILRHRQAHRSNRQIKCAPSGNSVVESRLPSPIRIFIADGHEIVRAGLYTLLTGERDVEVVGEADDVEDVLSQWRRTKPDVVLLGCGLLGGWETHLRKRLFSAVPSIRIITTMWNREDDDAALRSITECGAQGYLCKNIGGAELVQAIREVAKGGTYLNPEGIDKTFRLLKQAQGTHSRLCILSAQEKRIISLIAEGNTNKEIAVKLALSDKTVKNYIANIFSKLEIERRTQAVALYMKAQQHLNSMPGEISR